MLWLAPLGVVLLLAGTVAMVLRRRPRSDT
jgi:hypothetical protein